MPFANPATLTLPVGAGRPGCPITVTKSCTAAPAGADVTTTCCVLWICVVMDEPSCRTRVCDAAPALGGDGLQFSSPEPAASSQVSCQISVASSLSWCPGSAK